MALLYYRTTQFTNTKLEEIVREIPLARAAKTIIEIAENEARKSKSGRKTTGVSHSVDNNKSRFKKILI